MDTNNHAPGPSGHGYDGAVFNQPYCLTCDKAANADICHHLQHVVIPVENLNSGWLTTTDPFQQGDHLTGPNSTSTSHWSLGFTNGVDWTQGSQGFANPITESTSWSSVPDANMYNLSANGRHAETLQDDWERSNGHAGHSGTSAHEERKLDRQDCKDEVPARALVATTERLLTPLLQRCLEQSRMPLQREIQGMALSENVTVEDIEAWFSRRLPDYIVSAARSCPPSSSATTTFGGNAPHAHISQEVLEEVQEYASRQFPTECASAQSRKSIGKAGKFQCTSGCGYSAVTRDAWIRHEQKRQGQDFWHCILCRAVGTRSFICSRKDKVLEHFRASHQEVPEADYEHVRSECKVPVEPVFERQCKFWNEDGPCSCYFKSWRDRIQHYLQHFSEKIRDGPWQLRFNRKRRFDGDDEHGPSENQTGTSSSGMATAMTKYGAASSPAGQVSNNRRPTKRRAGDCPALGASIHVPEWIPSLRNADPAHREGKVMVQRLINVVNLSWTDATDGLKYVALDDAPTHDCIDANRAIAFDDAPKRELDALTRTCASFREALSLTRDMGYEYLWIEQLCETHGDVKHRQVVFQRAVLILVLVPWSSSNSRISYYTCHYDNIQRVRAWAFEGMAVRHIQNLGHGAFGIVDEVRLGLAPDLYARKMLLGPKSQKMPKSKQFREVEIMQKLRHQNIAAFVAAYSDHRSLNILMQPVAECSLREFLLDPSRWSEKLTFIPRWFCSLASAVSYMHGLSLRHKDIKPANILIRDCDVYLSDFGTALDFSMTTSGSDGNSPMTPKYCAPEVASKLPRGRKADVFSLGCVFLELATVEHGWSLDDLDDSLGFRNRSTKMQAAYCLSLKACTRWIKKLRTYSLSRYQRTRLQLCGEMLACDAAGRPAASEVHDILVGSASLMPLPSYVTNALAPPRAYTSGSALALGAFDLRAKPDMPGSFSSEPGITSHPQQRQAAVVDVWRISATLCETLIWLHGRAGTGKSLLTNVDTGHRPRAQYLHTASALFRRRQEPSKVSSEMERAASELESLQHVLECLIEIRASRRKNCLARVTGSVCDLPYLHTPFSRKPPYTHHEPSVNWERTLKDTSRGEKTFEYDALGLHSMRLLRVHPGGMDIALECSLMTCDLESPMAYEVLSHTWGEESASSSIMLSSDRAGHSLRRMNPFNIRPNLHKALKHFRLRDRPRVLWVEALCINPADFAERCNQVSKMGRIYSQADSVLVWLGNYLSPSSPSRLDLIQLPNLVLRGLSVVWENRMVIHNLLRMGLWEFNASSGD